MASSTSSRSRAQHAPKSSSREPSSRSHAGSARPAESSGSRLPIDPRRDLTVPIAVEVHRRDRAVAREYATNLSTSGICLHLRAPLPAGEPVRVVFEIPGEDGAVEARGRVSWAETTEPGVDAHFFEAGVRFEVVADADRDRIQRFVRLCEPAETGAG